MANLQLTFDDGPLGDGKMPRSTLTNILQVLDETGNKAAFFILGNEIGQAPSLLNDIYRSPCGHSIGNHSWSHPNANNITESVILNEFLNTHNKIKQTIGIDIVYWRAPYLAGISKINSVLRTNSILNSYLSHCDVHADSKDSQGLSTASDMSSAILNDISRQPKRTNFRILFHVKPTTANSLRDIIRELERHGHHIVNFDQTG